MATTFRVRTESQMQAMFDRATTKSDEQARVGNLPRLVRYNEDGEPIYAVTSRTTSGSVYLVHVDRANYLTCECEATGWCWHRTHVQRARGGEIGTIDLAALRARVLHMTRDIYR